MSFDYENDRQYTGEPVILDDAEFDTP